MVGTKAQPRVETQSIPRTSLRQNDSKSTNCIVAGGTKIEGVFRSAENLRMDGHIEGELKCDKKLVMGKGGFVDGKIFAKDAVIMGSLQGEINIEGTLHLQSTARINGKIFTKYLVVDDGAVYNGTCKVGSK